MGIVYAVVNQKGGVGKTTTAVNLAAALALVGKRVLLLDLDPQGNATSGVGIDKNTIGSPESSVQNSTYDVLINETSLQNATTATSIENLFLVPSNLDLAGAEIELISRISREMCLKNALRGSEGHYDYIFIDAPPSLGLLTLNALTAADGVILPIQCEYYALEGVSQLLRTFDLVKRQLNPSLEIAKVILTMYDNRVRLAQQVVAEVKEVFKEKVAATIIPRNVRLSEAPSHGLPVMVYDPKSRGAVAYREIAQEILEHGKTRTGARA